MDGNAATIDARAFQQQVVIRNGRIEAPDLRQHGKDAVIRWQDIAEP